MSINKEKKIMSFPYTIVGIATAAGPGGISIVRISGPESIKMASGMFRCASPPLAERPDRTVIYGHVLRDNIPVDEAIAIIMRAPHSYTKEDVVEVQCHGGYVAAETIMRIITDAGAQPAAPGEFTKRAFLNGRIDLVQAEAVLDIINAQSFRAEVAAMEQLGGSLSSSLKIIYEIILSAQSDLEASLDFVDDELSDEIPGNISARLEVAGKEMEKLLSTWKEGHLLRNGAVVVISGSPNVGKSTLLNALLGKDRAIVSEIPGTTRDIIEESILINGIPLRLVDTAGLRGADCRVEQQGIERARLSMRRADMGIYVVDISSPLTEEDKASLAILDPHRTIIVRNKTDLGKHSESFDFQEFAIVDCCLLRDSGVEAVKEEVIKKTGTFIAGEPHAVISERHRVLLSQCAEAVKAAGSILAKRREEAFLPAASELRTALESLGIILGKTYYEDLLDSIFSRFCVGK